MRHVFCILVLISVVGCESAPTKPGPTLAASDVKIHHFQLGNVTPISEKVVSLGFTYAVTATECALFVFEGEQANTAKILGGAKLPASLNASTYTLVSRVSGRHLVELRCVHEPSAQTGVIEKRYITIP